MIIFCPFILATIGVSWDFMHPGFAGKADAERKPASKGVLGMITLGVEDCLGKCFKQLFLMRSKIFFKRLQQFKGVGFFF